MELVTIERHIVAQEPQVGASGRFSALLYDMALCAKLIARETRRQGLTGLAGAAGTINVQGEMQQKLDVFANNTIIRMTSFTGRLCAMASEEEDDLVPIPREYRNGKYVLVFDPLDGSSNIDTNVSVGTIFGIYGRSSAGDGPGDMSDVLQPGHKLTAAGYVIYGPSTMMVYSTGKGVHGFTLDPTFGEFLLSHPDIRFPSSPKYYSCNQANERGWSDGTRAYTRWLQGDGPNPPKKPLSSRYVGSLVSDFHRNLLDGGVYFYPGDKKNLSGKLRLLYECAPLAFIAKHAGGYASTGTQDILQMQPDDLHHRVPLFIGDRKLVEQAEAVIRLHDHSQFSVNTGP